MDTLDTRHSILDTGYSIADAQPASKIEQQKSREEVAKDFESLFVNKLLDEMKNTIGEWGLETDEISKQVQGIFWLYLAQDIANKGGLGLWKDIYGFLVNSERTNTAVESLGMKL